MTFGETSCPTMSCNSGNRTFSLVQQHVHNDGASCDVGLRSHLDALHFEVFKLIRGLLALHRVCLLFHLQRSNCNKAGSCLLYHTATAERTWAQELISQGPQLVYLVEELSQEPLVLASEVDQLRMHSFRSGCGKCHTRRDWCGNNTS